jgi:hypothetical protein
MQADCNGVVAHERNHHEIQVLTLIGFEWWEASLDPYFFSFFFVRCILSMCFPKKRNSESPGGSPDFKRSEALVSLCTQSAARSGDFNICERVSYLSTLWHVQNHAQVHLSCTWTGNGHPGYGHPSAISDFFLFGDLLPNFNLKNLI